MTQPDPGEDPTLFPKTAGERLREAREAQGLSLAEVAARTRIQLRHLEAIETGDYASLPSVTYAVGFAKAYARVVGVDEVTIGREVRSRDDQAPRGEYQAYAITDPARAPSRSVAWIGAALALLVLIGVRLWYGADWFRGDGTAPAPAPSAEASAPPPMAVAPPTVAAGGPVVLTATDEVWLRVYDGGKTLFENTLKPGEHYDVPAEAADPMINIGRPDKLQVTLGGAAVRPLGDGSHALKDVRIGAAALAGRAGGAPLPASTSTPTPTPRATSTSSSRSTTRKSSHQHRDTRDDTPPLNIAAPASVGATPPAPIATGKPTP